MILLKPTRAMTLAEVLIAIGMIATIAVLLLPVISSLRSDALSSRCAQQLRQIGTGLLSWSGDHQGKLIPAAVIRSNLYWFDLLNPYLGHPEFPETYRFPAPAERGTAFPLSWQQCPGQKFANPSRESVGYGWNYMNFGHTGGKATFGSHSRLVEVAEPSRTIIIGDSRDWDGEGDRGFEGRYLYEGDRARLAQRHRGGGNYLMLDGHVEALSPEDLRQQRDLWKKQ